MSKKKKDVVVKVDLVTPALSAIYYHPVSNYVGYKREYIYSFAVEKLFLQQQSVQLTWIAYNYRFHYSNGSPDQYRGWFQLAPE